MTKTRGCPNHAKAGRALLESRGVQPQADDFGVGEVLVEDQLYEDIVFVFAEAALKERNDITLLNVEAEVLR